MTFILELELILKKYNLSIFNSDGISKTPEEFKTLIRREWTNIHQEDQEKIITILEELVNSIKEILEEDK